ncbi:DNA-processing protein DprA [Myxococcota bacterium]|nr:DNA-processing protein DprA [Myxococcota bacterium]
MTHPLSDNAQAILLLTAPLLLGPGVVGDAELLSPGEYARLAVHLRAVGAEPASLLGGDVAGLLAGGEHGLDPARAERLLGRGVLLSQAVERWAARSIWVCSRADARYPRRLRAALRHAAPPILYGCGDAELLEAGGLAVVGSRDVNETLLKYAEDVGALAARSGVALVSGGARGVDQAGMRGALLADGRAVGVLADSLGRVAVSADTRAALRDGRLVLVSPYDPTAGFNVGHAMQRNKLIYALSDAALVVNAEVGKGGTWAGAVEQVSRLRLVPVYCRTAGPPSEGLSALMTLGAHPWPEPTDTDTFLMLMSAPPAEKPPLDLRSSAPLRPTLPAAMLLSEAIQGYASAPVQVTDVDAEPAEAEPAPQQTPNPPQAPDSPAAQLFSGVRSLMLSLLTTPKTDAELSGTLGVLPAQTKVWVQQLVEEGAVERLTKPTRFVSRRASLFPTHDELGASSSKPKKRTASSRR